MADPRGVGNRAGRSSSASGRGTLHLVENEPRGRVDPRVDQRDGCLNESVEETGVRVGHETHGTVPLGQDRARRGRLRPSFPE